jgi:two-component system invasion response regulator UvrY
MIRVLVADSICTNRLGFRSVIETQNQCCVIDEAPTEESLIMQLTSHDYDLVVVEPTMADKTGEVLLRRIMVVAPRCNVLVLTELSEDAFGIKALRSGARGYLVKASPANEIEAAVTRVSQGKVYVTPNLAALIARKSDRASERPLHESLSEREFQVFALLVCGKKIINIASELRISSKTVSTHKLRVFEKLHIRSITDAVKYAISHDLLERCRISCNGVFDGALFGVEAPADTRGKGVLPEPAVGKHSGTSVT